MRRYYVHAAWCACWPDKQKRRKTLRWYFCEVGFWAMNRREGSDWSAHEHPVWKQDNWVCLHILRDFQMEIIHCLHILESNEQTNYYSFIPEGLWILSPEAYPPQDVYGKLNLESAEEATLILTFRSPASDLLMIKSFTFEFTELGEKIIYQVVHREGRNYQFISPF